jgi:hypothetical protein
MVPDLVGYEVLDKEEVQSELSAPRRDSRGLVAW